VLAGVLDAVARIEMSPEFRIRRQPPDSPYQESAGPSKPSPQKPQQPQPNLLSSLCAGWCCRLELTMPCLLLLVILLFPRVVLVLMWLTSTYLQRAFHGGLLVPLLGFIFLPLTTLVYAWEINSHMPMAGINLLWLLIAVIIDLGGLGGGAHRQSRG
jgi:hypothetical protein